MLFIDVYLMDRVYEYDGIIRKTMLDRSSELDDKVSFARGKYCRA